MRTSKPISTISYNSDEFLQKRLNELMRNHTIAFWAYIEHSPESDEKKAHKHLYVEPNKMVDTARLREFFDEMVPDSIHPLGCTKWVSSKPDDWLLYALHEPAYLASKMQEREYRYGIDEVVTSNLDDLDMMYRHAFDGSEWSKRNKIMNMLTERPDMAVKLLASGALPLQQAVQIRAYLQMLDGDSTVSRNGHENHD